MSEELTVEELRILVDHKEEIIHQLNLKNDTLLEEAQASTEFRGKPVDTLRLQLAKGSDLLRKIRSEIDEYFSIAEIKSIGGEK